MSSSLDRVVALAAGTVRGHMAHEHGREVYIPPHPTGKRTPLQRVTSAVPSSRKRFAQRADDARVSQGQTPTNFHNETTGAGMQKTETGDTFEQLFAKRFAPQLAARFGKLSLVTGAGGGTSRTTALDFKTPTHAVELKTLSSLSKNLKTAIKGEEIVRKHQAAAELGLQPLLLVQVVNQATRTVSVYGMERYASKNVSRMEKLGDYKYTADHFRQAQEASGHAVKAAGRAAREAV